MTRHAQYVVSDDPRVIGAIERNIAAKDALFFEKVKPWAKERGAERVVLSSDGGRVTGLEHQPTGFGQWTKPKYGQSKPYRTNVAELAILKTLTVEIEPVPGVPQVVDSVRDYNMSFYWMKPRPFLHDGKAWIGLGHAPDPERTESQLFGPEWRECLSSEYHAARSAFRSKSGASQ